MTPRPLQVRVWGVGRFWRARVTAGIGHTGRWRKVRVELGREVEGTSAALAVRKALTAYAREEATCRLCGGKWERRRGAKVRDVCPRCHNRKRGKGSDDADETTGGVLEGALADRGEGEVSEP